MTYFSMSSSTHCRRTYERFKKKVFKKVSKVRMLSQSEKKLNSSLEISSYFSTQMIPVNQARVLNHLLA